jgi:transglutaminase-like putative cysteine protease
MLAAAWAAAFSCAPAGARSDVLNEVNQLEQSGRFKEAAAALAQALAAPSLSAAEQKKLEFERDRLEWIKKDYPLTQAGLFAALKRAVKGLTPQEYDRWVAEGRFDSREFDGERRFMNASVANLFFRYPELEPRRVPPKDTAPQQRQRWETCVAIQQAARAEGKPYVLPKRFHTSMTVKAAANAAPAGEVIRAWLPIPRRYPFQGGFELLSSSAPVARLDDENSPVRSILLEQQAQKGKETKFTIEYNYSTCGVWFDVQPGQVKACDPNDAALREFLVEGPHIAFTPEVRALSQQILGGETNPWLKARKCYDWMAEHITYSYAIEYSTIRNISDSCRSHGYGDCGQEALLFMTLCRFNGLPARWQSGWNTFPGEQTIHDWCEIYVAPYGWVPVDPYMGIYATRYATALTPEQRRTVRDFYCGGLDYYRMVANGEHSQPLRPPKQSLRSDNVDFQRGELEWGSHNLYFDQFSHSFTVQEIEAPPPSATLP